jgi:hypothetical protein
MRKGLLAGLLGIFVMSTGALACGDSSDGGAGGTNGGNNQADCTNEDFSCSGLCANSEAVCQDEACGGEGVNCDEPEQCAQSCEVAKQQIATLTAEQKKGVLAIYNCLASNGTCSGYQACFVGCLSGAPQ